MTIKAVTILTALFATLLLAGCGGPTEPGNGRSYAETERIAQSGTLP